MDTSAREAMKDAAKCEKHCDLQISANQQISERIMRERGLPFLQACVSVFRIVPLTCSYYRLREYREVLSLFASTHLIKDVRGHNIGYVPRNVSPRLWLFNDV